jgi:tetratricopeptide (TPR) repeat protein
MKNILITLVLCLSLLPGCAKTDEKKSPALSAATEHPQKLEDSRNPNYPGLIEEYRTILAEDPNNLAAIVALGNAYFDSGQWKRAIKMYEHALRIDPRNADVRTDMGTSYRNIGMPDRALAEYFATLRQEPAHLNARYNMGIIYAYDKKDYKAAIHIWEELLRLAPNFPHADSMRSCIITFRKADKKDCQ